VIKNNKELSVKQVPRSVCAIYIDDGILESPKAFLNPNIKFETKLHCYYISFCVSWICRINRQMQKMVSGNKNIFYYAAWRIIDLKREVRSYKTHQKQWCKENPNFSFTTKYYSAVRHWKLQPLCLRDEIWSISFDKFTYSHIYLSKKFKTDNLLSNNQLLGLSSLKYLLWLRIT